MMWYVRRGEREVGPLGEDALRALVGTGQITADTPLWRDGLLAWTAALELPGVFGPRAVAPLTPGLPLATASLPPSSPSIPVAPDSGAPEASRPQVDAVPFEPATPWRRYWARLIDIMVSMFLVTVMTGAIRPSLTTQLNAAVGTRWVLLLLLLPFALTLDSLIYWALGNTPGKAVAGIKVLTEDGRRLLRAPAYLGRNFGVYFFGLGLGLPLISLFTVIYGYRRAAAGDASTWDRFAGSRVYALSDDTLRTWLAAGLYVLAMAAAFALGLHAQHKRSTYAATHAPAPVLQQELIQAANGVNAATPKMIDRITRLDGARVGPGSLFTYEYTLTNMNLRQLSPVTLATLRWRLSAHVRQAVCSGTALKPMLRTGTTVRFDYHDRNGQGLVLVSVSSADCGT
ncbi:MAG TPA: RDD family protein [Steroidobacteraceae bacterium]|nr:RDD family protein [Steroidobacteraceae bacterium]